MKFGLSDDQFKILENILIQPLKAQNAKLFVFGSRARGNHHPFSDIDILIEQDPLHPISANLIFNIQSELEDSNLAIKVDLVLKQNLAPSYRESILRDAEGI